MEDQAVNTQGSGTEQNAAAAETAAQGTPAAETSQENVTAFQKFLNGLFSGKEKAADGAEKTKEGTEEDAGKGKEKATGADAGKAFTQADIDAAVRAAKEEWEKAAAEEKRVAALSPEEKAAEEQTKKDARIAELEATLRKSQLKAKATAQLEKDGFPTGLAELLDYSGEKEMEESLKSLTGMFQDSVGAAVKGRLRGKTPEGLGAAASGENSLADQIAKNIRGL